jgi:hypothetical protein
MCPMIAHALKINNRNRTTTFNTAAGLPYSDEQKKTRFA